MTNKLIEICGVKREDVARLRAIYFDTPDTQLANKGISLRIRQSGRRRVQTVKGDGSAAGGLFTRQEWERPVRSNRPVLDAQTPVRDALGEAVDQIEPMFETDIERMRWQIEEGDAKVEMVIDRGVVRAGAREAVLCEVELELVAGAPAALFAIARRIDAEVSVRPAVLSKAERGYLLRGPIRESVKAEPVLLDTDIVTDRSTFQDPLQESVGVQAVMVNGSWVILEGKATGALPGRVLQRS